MVLSLNLPTPWGSPTCGGVEFRTCSEWIEIVWESFAEANSSDNLPAHPPICATPMRGIYRLEAQGSANVILKYIRGIYNTIPVPDLRFPYW